MSMRPPVFSLTSFAAISVAFTEGWLGAAVSPQRRAIASARPVTAGRKRPAPKAAAPAANPRFVSFGTIFLLLEWKLVHHRDATQGRTALRSGMLTAECKVAYPG